VIHEFLAVKDLRLFQHVVDRPSQAMGQDPSGFLFAVLAFKTADVGLRLTSFPKKQHDGLGKGPLQVTVPDSSVAGATSLWTYLSRKKISPVAKKTVL
jgi:hypothetical protein